MDDLALADTGTTGHYMTLDLPFDNKQQAVNTLPIQIPNGWIITPTHTALLYQQGLTVQARKAHIFPGLNKSLLSIGTLFDHICQATFDDKSVLILNKGSGKVIIKGTIDPHSNMYMLNLIQKNKLMTEFTTPDGYFLGSAYECKSKGKIVDYHHASCCSPNQYVWGKAITKAFFTYWPGLSFDLVQKYLSKKRSTLLGHLQQPRKSLRSTQEKVLQSEPDP